MGLGQDQWPGLPTLSTAAALRSASLSTHKCDRRRSTTKPAPAHNGPMRSHLCAYYLAVMTVLMPAASTAADIEVDVELFLAVDVSRSMTPRELEIQRRGYAEALTSPQVVNAITSGVLGRIALTYVEWAGSTSQNVIVDWSLISSRADTQAFAAKLTAMFNNSMRRTSISGAIDFASSSFADSGFAGLRRIIDISGDGPNNHGRPVVPSRNAALAKGIIINGLPLMTAEGIGQRFHLADLDAYYRNCVIGGPASFVIPVREWEQFPAAVRRKLVQELAGVDRPNAILAQFANQQPSTYDCMIGEKIWQQFRLDWYEP